MPIGYYLCASRRGREAIAYLFLKKKRGESFLEGALRQRLCSCRVGLVVAEPGLVRSGTGGTKKKKIRRRRRTTDLSPLILRTCIPWPGPHGHLKPSITRPWSLISTDSLTSINLIIRWTPLYSYELDRNCSDAHSCTAVLRSESRLALSQHYCLSWQMCLRIGSRLVVKLLLAQT